MAADGDEKELDGLAEREETPCGSNWDASVDQSVEKENDDEDVSQDNPTPSSPHDSGIGESAFYEPRDDGEEVTEELSDDLDHDGENMQDEDDQREMNGEGDWRNAGRKGRVRSSGSISESVPKGGGGLPRHKQARRRNHHHHQQSRGRRRTGNQLFSSFKELLSESVSSWFISCVHMMIEIIVTLTHNCGVGVEAGGVILYKLGQRLVLKISDVPGLRADATRLLNWTKSNATNLKDKLVMFGKFTMSSALSCAKLFCALVFLAFLWVKCALGRVGGERGKRFWTYVQESRFWQKCLGLMEKVRDCFRRRSAPSSPESPGQGVRGAPGQELERLLALADVPEEELDPFSVLGVEVHATEAELKKAYRQLAVQVHPDKNKHPRAGEAFKVLRAAWDIVSNPETKREYELKKMAASELSKSMNDFLTKLQDDLKEAMNTMMCTKCEGKHKRFEMDREPSEARFCGECKRRHSAEEGDLWAESSMLGLRITYFACMDGKVYDITEWAGCQRISISPDTHRVPYHISFGAKNSSSARHRAPSEHPPGPTNPADLQDFFNRIFKGVAPPTDMSANGAFFPSTPHPPPGPGPGTSTGPTFPPPPPRPSSFFMPGSQRPESAESWAESGKPPRRRKKVRKPFQR
ncbi:dnaJ homolog subfamily C member 14 [Eucyclogobius newberryi]|uniref:dnaJ homolog subfamily C member 14 n=1 Tax=Eucyclogobius newberryi TaxID=166745 RepID=UPI003B5BF0BE